MKKLLYAFGLVDSLTVTSFAVSYFNTEILLVGRTSSKTIWTLSPRHPASHHSFVPQWQRPISSAEQQEDTLQSSAAFYNSHAYTLSDINIGSHVAIQNPLTKAWDVPVYGMVTEIGLQCCYYVH